MSFRLKNAEAAYQHAIQLYLRDQLHHNVEACVDDVVINTKNPYNFIASFEETFNSLQRFWWKENHTRCIFGILS